MADDPRSEAAMIARVRSYTTHPYDDVAGRAAFFAADGMFEDPVGYPAVRGRDAIRQKMATAVDAGLRSALDVRTVIAAAGRAVAVADAQVTRHGLPHLRARTVMLFDFDEELLFKSLVCFVEMQRMGSEVR